MEGETRAGLQDVKSIIYTKLLGEYCISGQMKCEIINENIL